VGGAQSFSVAQPSFSGAILGHMKVEDIAEAVAKLPPDQLSRFRRCSPHSKRAAITLRSSTLLRLNSVASLAERLLNEKSARRNRE
jgi:hypothetical protein